MSESKKNQLSIFDLKLKKIKRQLKPSKVEKILKNCYEEKDHTEWQWYSK